MSQRALARLKRLTAVMRFGLLTARYAGPRIALRKLGHQLYGKTVFLIVVRPLDVPSPPGRVECSVRKASPEEVEEFFTLMHGEGKEARYQLLVRRWFHQRGFSNCYIAWTADMQDMVLIRWLVTADEIERAGWQDRFPRLGRFDAMTENVYTRERYRRQGYHDASVREMDLMFMQQGYKRRIGFIAADNVPSLMSNRKRGGRVIEKAVERHLLFQVRRRTVERYDPPVPIPIPEETG